MITPPSTTATSPWRSVSFPDAIETYQYHDGPVLFRTEVEGVARLATYLGEVDGFDSYLLSSPTIEQMTAMNENHLSVRDATLVEPFLLLQWTVDLEENDDWVVASIEALNPAWLPDEGAFLSAEATDAAAAEQPSI